jgi:hypothetical protein
MRRGSFSFVCFLACCSLQAESWLGDFEIRPFIRGDCNSDGKVDPSDPIFLVSYLFRVEREPPCLDACDIDDSGKIEVSDVVRLLAFFFNSGPPPLPPYPEAGVDPTWEDGLDCNQDLPRRWIHTAALNSLDEDPSLFEFASFENATVLQSDSDVSNIHSHYAEPGSSRWGSYRFRGKMRGDGAGSSFGVTFLSDYPRSDSYYRLRSYQGSEFHLAAHPHGSGSACDELRTGVVPRPGVWYHFLIHTEVEPSRTLLRVKVWEEGRLEPPAWQIDCLDASGARRSTGAVGCWSLGPGAKRWAALSVNNRVLAPFDGTYLSPPPGGMPEEPPAEEMAAGLFLSRAGLLRLQTLLQQGLEPYRSSFTTLISRADTALSMNADPFRMEDIRSIRFGWCETPDDVDDTLKELTNKLQRQSDRIRTLALAYVLTLDIRYADHARWMLLDWVRRGKLVNIYDFRPDFATASFDGITRDGACGVRPWNFALDAMWQTYGLINISDAYILLTRNGYTLEAAEDEALRAWILDLVEAVNSSFHAWTRWADANASSTSYRNYRSDNHLSWSLAGLLAGGLALGDGQLVRYCMEGASWTDRKAGAYSNPSPFPSVIENAIELEGASGRVHEERILRDPPIQYALFHLWAMSLVAYQGELHRGEDYWSTGGKRLELAFERYAAYLVGEATSPRAGGESNLAWYCWLWDFAIRRWPSQRFEQVRTLCDSNTFLIQSVGPLSLIVPAEESPFAAAREEPPSGDPPPVEEPPPPPPNPGEPAPSTEASSVKRHEITWTFSERRRVGQFANGDWWVIGPVRVLSVSPAPSGGRHGSMINPRAADQHAFDSRVSGYQSALGVTFPVTLQPGQSLVSTQSWLPGEPGFPVVDSSGSPRPALKRAAVLTCLASIPPADAFRPPYAGQAKPLYRTSQLRSNILPRLSPVSRTPSVNTAVRWFERVWLDVKMQWSGRYLHPSESMPDYGRDLAARLNDGYLMLLLDLPGKERVLLHLVQIGIDFNGLLRNGGHWPANGGHGIGRKWPILFAGLMLNDAKMQSIGGDFGPEYFSEDCQTFYVTAADKQRFPSLFPVIGAPAWGIRHCYAPERDADGRGYALCCTINASHPAALCARIMDAKSLWNHNAFFDYTDLHMLQTAVTFGVGDSRRSWSLFAEQMWDTYRSRY